MIDLPEMPEIVAELYHLSPVERSKRWQEMDHEARTKYWSALCDYSWRLMMDGRTPIPQPQPQGGAP